MIPLIGFASLGRIFYGLVKSNFRTNGNITVRAHKGQKNIDTLLVVHSKICCSDESPNYATSMSHKPYV